MGVCLEPVPASAGNFPTVICSFVRVPSALSMTPEGAWSAHLFFGVPQRKIIFPIACAGGFISPPNHHAKFLMLQRPTPAEPIETFEFLSRLRPTVTILDFVHQWVEAPAGLPIIRR
jgi:hypothetical protein